MKKIILSIISIIITFTAIGQNIKGYYVEAVGKLEAKRAFVINLDTFYATTQLSGIDTILATKDYVDSRIIDTLATDINRANFIDFIENYSNGGTGFVPYTGATTDVNLGVYDLRADKIGIGVAVGTNEKLKVRLNNATKYSALIENSGSGHGVKIAAGSGSSDILLSMHDYTSGYEYFRFTGNGYFRTPNQTLDPTNVADYGFWYFKDNVPYAYINGNAYDLTATGGGASSPLTKKGDVYTYSTADARLPVGTNGQVLTANSATSTGLQWVTPSSGSSIWTDAGTYAYLNGLENIYLPSNKGLYWRNSTANVTGDNLYTIIPGTGKLDIKYGTTPTTIAEFYSTGTFNILGQLSVGNGAYTLPVGDGTSSQVLTTDGSGTVSWQTPGSGGMTDPMTTRGDLIYRNSSNVTARLPIGTTGKVLTSNGTDVSWQTPSSGFANPMTTLGDLIYGASGGTATRLAGAAGFLKSTGAAAPTWSAVTKADVGLSLVENTALSTWAGSSNITTLGTIATGVWSASAIGATKGGTGQSTYTTGDILVATATNTLGKLSAGTSGYVLKSNGVGVAPSWQVDATGGVAGVTSVTASAPLASSGGTTPNITITTASTSTNGALTSTDWNTFNSKMNGSGTVTSGVFPIYNGTGGKDLAESFLSANLSHGGITNTISTTGVYSATFVNTNNTGGAGLLVKGGVGSSSNIVKFNDYANNARFSINGSGAVFAKSLTVGVTDTVLYWDSTLGEIRRGLKPTATTNGWTDSGTDIVLTTNTDRVVIGSDNASKEEALYVSSSSKNSSINSNNSYYNGIGISSVATGNYGYGIVSSATAIGSVGVAASGVATDLYLNGSGKIMIASFPTAPVSSTATGTTGEVRITADYIYVCTATNTWKRVALSTW